MYIRYSGRSKVRTSISISSNTDTESNTEMPQKYSHQNIIPFTFRKELTLLVIFPPLIRFTIHSQKQRQRSKPSFSPRFWTLCWHLTTGGRSVLPNAHRSPERCQAVDPGPGWHCRGHWQHNLSYQLWFDLNTIVCRHEQLSEVFLLGNLSYLETDLTHLTYNIVTCCLFRSASVCPSLTCKKSVSCRFV